MTGPTQIAATCSRSASASSLTQPRALARCSIDATAGALVKLTASTSALTIIAISWSIGRLSSGCSQRYTGTLVTSAPAMVSASQMSALGSHSEAAPCNCTAMRKLAAPSASSRSSTSGDASDSGLHSSRQAGLTDRTTRLRAPRQDAGRRQRGDQIVGDVPTVRGLDPAAEADAGRHHDDVGRLFDEKHCDAPQFDVVNQRDDPDRRRVDDGGAAALEQRDEFFGPAGRGDPDRETC